MRWTLTEMGGRSFTGSEPYLEFDVKQNRFSGSGGCNRFMGGYKRSGTDLKFTAVASTKRACLDTDRQQVENSFLKALETVTRFEIQGDVIRLYATENLLLTFKASAR
jgi:heat shock protein HslJ